MKKEAISQDNTRYSKSNSKRCCICELNVVKFTLAHGDIHYSGHTCLIHETTNISIIAFMSSRASDGTVDTKYTAHDKPNQGGNEIACIDITAIISV